MTFLERNLDQHAYKTLCIFIKYLKYKDVSDFIKLTTEDYILCCKSPSQWKETVIYKRYNRFKFGPSFCGVQHIGFFNFYLNLNKRDQWNKNIEWLANEVVEVFLNFHFSNAANNYRQIEKRYKRLIYVSSVFFGNDRLKFNSFSSLAEQSLNSRLEIVNVDPMKYVEFKAINKIRELETLVLLLKNQDFIDDDNQLKSLFYPTKLNIYKRINWKKTRASSIFFIRLLIIYDVIDDCQKISSKVSKCFKFKGVINTNKALNSACNNTNFGEIGFNINSVKKYVKQSSSKDIKTLFTIFNIIFEKQYQN